MSSQNLSLARQALDQMTHWGVCEFVLCAGARNAPLVQMLSVSHGLDQGRKHELKVYSFFDERSAAFFALGRSRSTMKPVAVLTTSGTAAAELLPATIEAYYTGLPICLVTADRPKRFQNSGAPQTIEQVGLFSHYVERVYDWSESQSELQEECSWSLTTPLHLNLRFEEPIWEGHVEPYEPKSVRSSLNFSRDNSNEAIQLSVSVLDPMKTFLCKNKNTVAIIGALPSERVALGIQKLLCAFQIPYYAESSSFLRGSSLRNSSGPSLRRSLELCSSEKILNDDHIGSLLRIGGIPTARKWRDLDEQREIPLLSIHHLPFKGLAHGELIQLNWDHFVDFLSDVDFLKTPFCNSNWSTEDLSNLMSRDKTEFQKLESHWKSHPHAEPSLIRKLSQLILKEQNQLFLGNSLTLRNWDLAALRSKTMIHIGTNRGANGIDGILSTFLGWADDQKINWLIMGDLTALYDLNGLWALSQRPHLQVRIVIINNGGGMIFRHKFGHPLFENQHKLNFNHWAAMWGLNYKHWNTDIPEHFESSQNHIIEISVHS